MAKNFENILPPIFTPELQERVVSEMNQLASVRNMEIGYFNGRSFIDGVGAAKDHILSAGHELCTHANTCETASHNHSAGLFKSGGKGFSLGK